MSITEVPSSIGELKGYLRRLRGRRALTFEETTTSQWLYTELRNCVDEILVCDPYRNKLLNEGAKTDRIDARKIRRECQPPRLAPARLNLEFILVRGLTP